ncbi:uncharacterized protein LOC111394349 [Olea europaea var. sylvestris]|uniref:Uncharacterized protein n=1 Tax=Olea europaea subsp. europaea TaxID=158383 RepID=A0A8S0SJH9_OLEEU|nr:uncharacterized protein LOC111394349 [Olea europaea var. sylvestris]CAA2992020.1 Hypothetical predicted protein [Olea europaea subsp. europaea]
MGFCNFHPKEEVVGVCALCLNERLQILASKNGYLQGTYSRKKTQRPLPKIFALSNLLNRLDIGQQKSEGNFGSSSSSQEDSFISIKFEDNGEISWNQKWRNPNGKINSVAIEQSKPRAALRWQKRIGNLFQLIKWKRSSKGNVCHVGTKLDRSKVRYGWIRTLRKRTKE